MTPSAGFGLGQRRSRTRASPQAGWCRRRRIPSLPSRAFVRRAYRSIDGGRPRYLRFERKAAVSGRAAAWTRAALRLTRWRMLASDSRCDCMSIKRPLRQSSISGFGSGKRAQLLFVDRVEAVDRELLAARQRRVGLHFLQHRRAITSALAEQRACDRSRARNARGNPSCAAMPERARHRPGTGARRRRPRSRSRCRRPARASSRSPPPLLSGTDSGG